MYTSSIFHQHTIKEGNTTLLTAGLPPAAQQILAGPFAGAASDFNLLAVFSIYDVIRKQTTLSEKSDNHLLWKKLYGRLFAAQALDPMFWDVYRLAVGLIAFHEQGASTAVDLLSKGAESRTWDWEMPFMAGFLAHDFLHDDKRASALMSEAIKRPNAPSLAVGLASQFLNASEGRTATLRFLYYLRASMPAEYRGVIDARIKNLEFERSSR